MSRRVDPDRQRPPDERQLPPRVVRSEALFAGRRMIVIEHAGEQYRLLTTKNNRLILQK